MVDLADLSWPVMRYRREGRHGLAYLHRYQAARREGKVPDERTLAYLDTLAEAFLKAGGSGSGDARTAAQRSELGLGYPKAGRPKKSSLHPHYDSDFKPTRRYRAALRRAELVESGKSRTAADDAVRDEFGYTDAREVRKATRDYAYAVEQEMRKRESDRQWRANMALMHEVFRLGDELRDALSGMQEPVPRTRLLLSPEVGERPELWVTFPPTKQSLDAHLPGKESENDPEVLVMMEIGAICLADEHNRGVVEVREEFDAWWPEDELSFAKAALAHLRSHGMGHESAGFST